MCISTHQNGGLSNYSFLLENVGSEQVDLDPCSPSYACHRNRSLWSCAERRTMQSHSQLTPDFKEPVVMGLAIIPPHPAASSMGTQPSGAATGQQGELEGAHNQCPRCSSGRSGTHVDLSLWKPTQFVKMLFSWEDPCWVYFCMYDAIWTQASASGVMVSRWVPVEVVCWVVASA